MQGFYYFCRMEHEKKILLHTCCAPCASASIERLQDDGWQITLYYSNSNMDSLQEFQHRLSYVRYLAQSLDLPLEVDAYNPDAWSASVQGLEREPERGSRCDACFGFSLAQTAQKAQALQIPFFCTTLTISPHKRADQIQRAGNDFPAYYHYDFKKRDGYKRSLELSERYNFYRQAYCGCLYSKAERGLLD